MLLIEKHLHNLINKSIIVLNDKTSLDENTVITINFADSTKLTATFWRLIVNGKEKISSFDHNQQYGLEDKVNAKDKLQNLLEDKLILDARLDPETADLHFKLSEATTLTIFSFTAYEDWDIVLPNGHREYSNHVKTCP